MRSFSCGLRRSAGETGAVAVEFALVTPVLLALIFAILDFGFWFNESLNVRQGVREAARMGVVQNFGAPSCSGSAMDMLVCTTKRQVGGGAERPAYARVVVPAAGWKRGEPLLVCGMVHLDALTGFIPLPADGLVKSKTSMSIEAQATTAIAAGTYGDAAPSGADWSWCA